jgi:O-acetyl-ADP-ribose deacetylase (regulator of RNase III)
MAQPLSKAPQFQFQEVKGDLFGSPKDFALAHCVSRDLEMSKGIAVKFKEHFGGVCELRSQQKTVGQVAVLTEQFQLAQGGCALETRPGIFYLVTKEKYYHKPTYITLQHCLDNLKEFCEIYQIDKLAIPQLGCGLDKLHWSRVRNMIQETFKNHKTDICICVYSL